MEKKQFDLFNEPVQRDWEKEWKDMPEFIQENKTAFKQIIINFKSMEDVEEFAKLINQSLTIKTKSVWFPKVEVDTALDKRWIADKNDP